jgi:hypothetical protein
MASKQAHLATGTAIVTAWVSFSVLSTHTGCTCKSTAIDIERPCTNVPKIGKSSTTMEDSHAQNASLRAISGNPMSKIFVPLCGQHKWQNYAQVAAQIFSDH